MSNCKQRPYVDFSVTFDRAENTAILKTNNIRIQSNNFI